MKPTYCYWLAFLFFVQLKLIILQVKHALIALVKLTSHRSLRCREVQQLRTYFNYDYPSNNSITNYPYPGSFHTLSPSLTAS